MAIATSVEIAALYSGSANTSQRTVLSMGSEGLRAEAAKMNLDIEPIPGDDLQTLIAGLYATPAHVVERARQALTAKAQK